jgi:hypothetical protein
VWRREKKRDGGGGERRRERKRSRMRRMGKAKRSEEREWMEEDKTAEGKGIKRERVRTV